MTEGIGQLNQENIWTLAEEETHTYTEILETVTMKWMKVKEKKQVSRTKEKISWNQDFLHKSHKKYKHVGCPPYKNIGTFFKWTKVV